MAAVEPHPVSDHDPFSLGDSDDEEAKKTDVKAGDTERLREAAAEAMADHLGSADKKDLQPHEKVGSSGTGNKEAEEKLTADS